ncbi:lymphocyte-specific helicase-like [Belonocnema kinseyi]|uniref:lymphocyte-specific helicase-like n=1 Tax=Belonocnema kinseyi TaxID=2817044 RepID=UPI00143D787D|nr:lymphocyte-specific helicase-like [Belonocnema kinseyi]
MEEQEEDCFTAPQPTNERNLVSPVKLDLADDSGFSSIAGSIAESTISNNESEKPASAVVDTQHNAFALLQQKKEEKRRKLEEEREKRRLAEEEYNREVSERRYKRLMHLLDKSQFYANLILKKNDDSTKTSTSMLPQEEPPEIKAPTKKMPTKRKVVIPKENSPPAKRPRRNVRPREEHDLKDFVTTNATSRLRDRKKMKKRFLQEDEEDDNPDSSLESVSEKIEDVSLNATEDEVEFTPSKYFVGELRDYQIEGLKWLKVLYKNGLNGILADEMGLGKTIQVIALFCELIENRHSGPFLIVAPLSTIPNWLLEFERFAPSLPVVLFHGPPEERSAAHRKIKQKYLVENGYKTQPIVITTYEVPLWEKSFLRTQKWRYIVIDEGHRIKNHQCQLVKVLKMLKSMNRLLLTGTPLQNNLAELWSLLNFLLPDIFNDLAVFESWFDVKELQHEEGTMKFLRQEEEKKVVASLREILKPFMLRRVKTDVCLEIPAKKEIIVYAPLTELQRDLYKAVLNRDLQTLSKIEEDPVIIDIDGVRPKRKCVLKNSCDSLYSKALKSSPGNSLKNLESLSETTSLASYESVEWYPNKYELKMSPLDIADKKDVWTDFSNLGEVMKKKSNSDCEKTSASSKTDQSIHKLRTNIQNPAPSCNNSVDEFGSKNSLIFNMNKMMVGDKDDNLTLDKMLCKEDLESKSLSIGSSATSSFTVEKNPSKSLKKDSKILGLSSVSKVKFSKKVPSQAISTKNIKKNKKSLSLNNLNNSTDKMIEKHYLSNGNISLISKESDEDFDGIDGKEYPIDRQKDLLMWRQYTDVNERNQEFFIHLTFGSRLPMYKKIVNHPYLMHCPLDSCGLPTVEEDLVKASGKLMVLDQMLAKLKERGHKILLFSTWTKILDILEDYLCMRNYLYVRLDGGTKIEQRKENITIFNNDPNVFIFLISTRAGGVGLNLAGADTVIIYDSDWNPQADIQAMARCHRIGQSKPVVVYKFCTKGTIDEEIIKRADVKRKLEKMVISKKDIGYNLNNKDNLLKLKQLLGSNDCQVVSSEKDG